ncbi:hypothetical protein FSP39_019158 [Pinctada imbricata]|uniref:Uncharacterized protein n=1 Tax=Pinctada imbricata TaxID=66713 RepID=A0AA89BXU4_PINIB|nr:hypothetical protein FSP39_019158 [Pinctada imbricata]
MSKNTADLELERLLRQHNKKTTERNDRRNENKEKGRRKKKQPIVFRQGKSKEKRHVRPNQPLSAAEREAVNRYLRDVRINKYRELPRMQSRSEMDVRRRPNHPDVGYPYRNVRLSRDMADIVRLPYNRSLGRLPDAEIHANTLPYTRRPRGPRARPDQATVLDKGYISQIWKYPMTVLSDRTTKLTFITIVRTWPIKNITYIRDISLLAGKDLQMVGGQSGYESAHKYNDNI